MNDQWYLKIEIKQAKVKKWTSEKPLRLQDDHWLVTNNTEAKSSVRTMGKTN